MYYRCYAIGQSKDVELDVYSSTQIYGDAKI